MPLEIVRNDITKMSVDAIVNAANHRLQQGGGVCGAIFAAAGAEGLQAECSRIGYCAVGNAVLTSGYALSAKYIIHTVGPIWQGGSNNERELLASCYTNSLNLALEHGFGSVAFPLISSGIFGYPKDKALQVAISAIGDFLFRHEMTVYLVVFDKEAYTLSDKLFRSIRAYIDDNYAEGPAFLRRKLCNATSFTVCEAPSTFRNLDDVVRHVDESFSEMLLRLIDESGRTDSDVYRQANLDRRLFSKIRSNPQYRPSKNTALALAVALELNLDQTGDLLRRAGYALSPSSRFDLIVEYFIREGNYNIFEINEALFAFDESMLGA